MINRDNKNDDRNKIFFVELLIMIEIVNLSYDKTYIHINLVVIK